MSTRLIAEAARRGQSMAARLALAAWSFRSTVLAMSPGREHRGWCGGVNLGSRRPISSVSYRFRERVAGLSLRLDTLPMGAAPSFVYGTSSSFALRLTMGLIALLKRLVRGTPAPIVRTRLTMAEATVLGKQAAGNHWLCDSLNVATADRLPDGTVVWIVETGGVGSFLRIVLDDASGAVLDRKEHTGR